MKRKSYFLSLLLLVCSPVFAQVQEKPKELSLQEAIQFALGNNETIKKAKLDERSADYKVKEVTGSGLPQVKGTAQLSMYPSLPTQLIPNVFQGKPDQMIPVQFGTKYNANAGLELQQLLFSKSFFVGLEAAKSTKDLFQLRTKMSEEEIIYNVSAAYLQVLQTKEQFNTIEANFNKLAQLEKIIDLQYKNDLARKVDLNRITVNKTNLENQRQTLAAAFEQRKNALKFFMGLPMEQDIEIAAAAPELNKVILEKPSAENVLAQRTDYQLLNKQKQLSGLQLRNVKSGYYPTLAAFGQYSYQAQRKEFNFTDTHLPWFNTFVVGLQLNVPIFDGMQKRNRVKQAEIEIEKVNEDMQQLKQSTQMGLDNATKQIQTSQLAIQNQERNVKMAQEVYETTNQLYKEGISPLTDLLDAEVALRESETNLNNERLKYQLAQLDYLKASGELKSLNK